MICRFEGWTEARKNLLARYKGLTFLALDEAFKLIVNKRNRLGQKMEYCYNVWAGATQSSFSSLDEHQNLPPFILQLIHHHNFDFYPLPLMALEPCIG